MAADGAKHGRGVSFAVERVMAEVPTISASRILLMRQDRIGDVFVTTPVVRAIRALYPDAHIDYLVSKNNVAAAFSLTPFVDGIIIFSKSVFEIPFLRNKLRRAKYDLLIDFNHTASSTSRLLVKGARAAHSIGLEKADRDAFKTVVPQGDRSVRHIVDVLCDLTLPLGFEIPKSHRHLSVDVSPAVLQDVRPLVVHAARPVFGIQISGSSPERMYPIEKLRQIVETVQYVRTDVDIVILSAPSQERSAIQLARATNTRYVSAGTSYEHFAAAIASCNWILSPDTAAIHVAAAYSIPSVVLYSRDPRGFLNWFPYDAESWPIISDGNELAAIPVEKVHSAVAEMLSH